MHRRPACVPAAAAAITVAIGAVTLPAAYTPRTPVCPAASTTSALPNREPPTTTSSATRPSPARKSTRASAVLAAARASSGTTSPEPVSTPVSTSPEETTRATDPATIPMPRAVRPATAVSSTSAGSVTNAVTRSLSARNISAWCTPFGVVTRIPMRWSRISHPWQNGQCTTPRPHCSARPGTSGSTSTAPEATTSRRAVTTAPESSVTEKPTGSVPSPSVADVATILPAVTCTP